ncbi:GntR family transcriptional regulator [Microtetraspora malaysiensis]|uniref:GntR family transcriptional regulator n=1 Tax=Microtetraspora malaysiensis TaxID=161358 RepID=UPI003D90B0C6
MVTELRRMIMSGELLPGQQIRQESMAERLGVSRIPVREGLRQLTADGLVSHTRNVGYTVARLSQAEFDQIYVMRRLLETEVLRRLPPFTEAQLRHLTELNDEMAAESDRLDLAAMMVRNHDFHFAIFRPAGLGLLIDEIERLWSWAAPYHAVYLYSADSRQAVLAEHQAMIDALRDNDTERLIAIMDGHRHGSETQMGLIFSGAPIVRPSPA